MPLLSRSPLLHTSRIAAYARKHLNFFRIHLIFFTFTPLIFSAIFYASNGQYHIAYIDALFNSVSAITVCGLATVDLSSLTAWQQVILFMQMCLGSPVLVSWITVYVRRHFFAKKFESAIQARMEEERQRHQGRTGHPFTGWSTRLSTVFRATPSTAQNGPTSPPSPKGKKDGAKKHSRRPSFIKRLRPEMIRRVDDQPKLINPSGHLSEGVPRPATPPPTPRSSMGGSSASSHLPKITSQNLVTSPQPIGVAQPPTLPTVSETRPPPVPYTGPQERPNKRRRHERNNSDPGITPLATPVEPSPSFGRFNTLQVEEVTRRLPVTQPIPRTHTIEFALLDRPHPNHSGNRDASYPPGRGRSGSVASNLAAATAQGTSFERSMTDDRRSRRGSLHTYPTMRTHPTAQMQGTVPLRSKHRDFGGFPLPHVLAARAFVRFFPGARNAFQRTVTMPYNPTLPPTRNGAGVGPRYFSFDTLVGRNSAFPLLTNEQLEELGGVEYRALNALLWIVAGYHIGTQLICYVIIAPYISQSRWKEDFLPPALHRPVPPAWFGLFQIVSAYTNTGMSLVDQSMTPFQEAFGMIFPLIFLILAGNTAFPIFFRFTIWFISKLTPAASRLNETLHFLLDHPRRCFLYLFPSHQTWFLLTVVVALNVTDWFFFLVLDIGNDAIASVPLGTRFAIGLLQATAVRAAGFGTVSLSALTPAVKVLYVIMMYVSVYPIAMSVRSTNVYEEQSLGIFDEQEEDDQDDDNFQPVGHRVTIWSRYLAMHVRKQLSFDMWWLGLALFLVCIIERDALTDDRSSWFNIFNIMFELVSAYGTVGLSLGLPYANYSFSGAFSPLSKLIVCAVMLRGRHRGLPVAIDRAVMLPTEFKTEKNEPPVDEKANGDAATATAMGSGEGLNMTRTRTRRSVMSGVNGHGEGVALREKAQV